MDILEEGATKEEAPECCLSTLYEDRTGQVDRMEERDLLEVGGGQQRIWLVRWLKFCVCDVG